MKVLCSGIISSDIPQGNMDSMLLTGVNTKFLTELRPGDQLFFNSAQTIYGVVSVYSILSDTKLLCTNRFDVQVSNITFGIVNVNPDYVLHMKEPVYNSAYTTLGSTAAGAGTNLFTGGQIFLNNSDLSMSTLNNVKGLRLPVGYDYITPFTDLVLVSTTANSGVLNKVLSDVKVSTVKDSKQITYISGEFRHILEGLLVVIDGINYRIESLTNIRRGSYGTAWEIILDKPMHKSLSAVFMEFDSDFGTIYPNGSTVLLNGRLTTITLAVNGKMQVGYPMSHTAIVTVRKPLMATQYSLNTVELSNIEYSGERLKPGNLLIIQNLHSEDELYSINSCYTEIKHIARVFDDGRLLTQELNKIAFKGVVCIGYPNNGVHRISRVTECSSNGFNIMDIDVNTDGPFQTGRYLLINDEVYKVSDYNTYSKQVTLDRSIVPGRYTIYLPTKLYDVASYSPLIRSLTLKLAERIIKTQRKITMDLDTLMAEFMYSSLYSCEIFAERETIYSVYEPLLLAVNKYLAPPSKYEEAYTLFASLSSTPIEVSNRVFRNCGLPLAASKG
jgi:hypothetical protein